MSLTKSSVPAVMVVLWVTTSLKKAKIEPVMMTMVASSATRMSRTFLLLCVLVCVIFVSSVLICKCLPAMRCVLMAVATCVLLLSFERPF